MALDMSIVERAKIVKLDAKALDEEGLIFYVEKQGKPWSGRHYYRDDLELAISIRMKAGIVSQCPDLAPKRFKRESE